MMGLQRILGAILLTLLLLAAGCLGADESLDDLGQFPDFTSLADDGRNYSNSDFGSDETIILFSAEWCNAPCHLVMHQIYDVLGSDVNLFVMSTDPGEDITLAEWHEDANDYDDGENDVGNTLPWPFMKAVDAAQELDVQSRPTIYFVDDGGTIRAKNEGAFDSDDALRDMYAKIS